MSTIKDVAKLAGVSATTVSLIINGKAKERRISDETVARVYSIMQQVGYKANISARRLRSEEVLRPTIAFYWPSDYRTNILGSFLMHFPRVSEKLNFDCEIVVRTYTNGEIEKAASEIARNTYSGAIIGASSEEDLHYLEGLHSRTPLVIINRSTSVFSTVNSDNREIGFLAARLMSKKGYKEAAVFTSQRPYMATGLRVQSFLYACSELGINVNVSQIFRNENTIEGGVLVAKDYCKIKNAPKAIFCDSDSMALGALYTFHKQGIQLPKDVELIAVQLLEDEFTKYSIPSITTIPMQNAVVAERSLAILQQLIESPMQEPIHELIHPEIILRETFT